MICRLGLGSNLGDRLGHLEMGAQSLLPHAKILRASPVFENPALVPEGAPAEWHMPFMNAVLEIDWDGSPQELLMLLKRSEREAGRVESARWAPRVLDLDILSLGTQIIESTELRVPHPEMHKRQFVLSPLKHLDRSALALSRALPAPLPAWMGILNLTPDSFSGSDPRFEDVERKVESWIRQGVHIMDVGAESTRPSAVRLTPAQEWQRLGPTLEWLVARTHGRVFRPWISVDTYHPETARRALEMGVDILNDVSGLSDPCLLDVLRENTCQYVLMHSLTVPADPKVHLSAEDPVQAVKDWFKDKLQVLSVAGVDLNRVIVDPGVGFGKTAAQSLEILRRIDEFFDLNVRVLCGHSRKSFINLWGERPPSDREWESAGTSLRMAERGTDILRVHEPAWHARAHRAFRETGA